MALQEHVDILMEGVEAWNKWREEKPYLQPDLSEINLYVQDPYAIEHMIFRENNLYDFILKGVDLSGINFKEVNLRHANLKRVILRNAELEGADFTNAELRQARLEGAQFFRSKCCDAKMIDARLDQARILYSDFTSAILAHASVQDAELDLVDLRGAVLNWTNFRGSQLTRIDLRGAVLIETNLNETTIEGCSVYGISAWKLRLERSKQSNLVIESTYPDEPSITVDDIELAQFIYLLLHHKKLRDIFNAVSEKGVLLLGRFSNGGLELLQAIAAKLREMNYLPMIFDFDRPENKNYTETVKTLVGLSKFVIVDLSGPSVPQELYATVPHYKIPFVPIIQEGSKSYSLFTDLREYPWILSPVEFSSREQLLELLPSRIIEPAEEKSKERQALLKQLFES